MSNYAQYLTGVQHIGIPTKDMDATIKFYQNLGFSIAFEKTNSETDRVVFMRLHNLTLEFYYSEAATGYSGAVDHIAIDCTNVDALYEQAKKDHLTIVETGELPYWDNGVKYFTITGPNQEKIEFSQYL